MSISQKTTWISWSGSLSLSRLRHRSSFSHTLAQFCHGAWCREYVAFHGEPVTGFTGTLELRCISLKS